MHEESAVKVLEQQVRKLAKPLGELMESLESEIRPTRRHAYRLDNDFKDEFAQWGDIEPPPWMGEDRLI